MNRRSFLRNLVGGVVAATTLLHLPENLVVALLPGEQLRSTAALEFLRNAYNKWMDAHMRPDMDWNDPDSILLGTALWERVNSEIVCVQRLTGFSDRMDDRPSIMFKASRCFEDKSMSAWGYQFVERTY